MNIDKLDLIIMREMWIEETITTTELAKRVFNIKTRSELQDKTSHITKRLNKLVRYGLVKTVTEKKKKYYYLNLKKCFFGVKIDNMILWVSLMK